jgi:hypothetical protein
MDYGRGKPCLVPLQAVQDIAVQFTWKFIDSSQAFAHQGWLGGLLARPLSGGPKSQCPHRFPSQSCTRMSASGRRAKHSICPQGLLTTRTTSLTILPVERGAAGTRPAAAAAPSRPTLFSERWQNGRPTKMTSGVCPSSLLLSVVCAW